MVATTKNDGAESLFGELAEAIDAAIFVYQRGWYVYVNSAATRVTGYSRAALLSCDPLTVFHPEERAAARERLALARPARCAEVRFLTGDGEARWMELSITEIHFRGAPAALLTCFDITERKQSEAALRASEAQFRAFMENSPAIAILKDESGRYVYANRGWWQQFPPERGVRLGMTDDELWEPETAQTFRESDRTVRESGQPVQVVEEGRDASGQVHHWMTFKFPVKDASGRQLLGGIVVDITDRVRAEELANGQSRILEMVATGAPLTATLSELTHLIERLTDADHCSVMLMDEAGKMLHVAAAPSLPESFCRTFDPFPVGPHAGSCGTAVYRGEPVAVTDIASDPLWEGLCEEALKYGLRACASRPIFGSDGRPLGAFAMYYRRERAPGAREWRLLEVSAHLASVAVERQREAERVREWHAELERRVQERTAQLEAANKELEAFSYSVSHDLRAPLRAIEGFSHILLEEHTGQLGEDGLRLLEIIRRNARRMSLLINDLLTFSRLSRQKPEAFTIDMQALAWEVVNDLIAAHTDISYAVTVGDLPTAYGDPRLIRQVLSNLIANAMKFTRPRPHPTIEVGGYAAGREQVYYVKDNGVGFDMRQAGKLFGVFQRLHRTEEFEGTGVGLAIIQRIIRRHGGRVWAEAKPQEGATFFFTLPPASGTPSA